MAKGPLKKPEAPKQKMEKMDKATYLQRRAEIMETTKSRRTAMRRADVLKSKTVDKSKAWKVVETMNLLSKFRYGIKSPAVRGETVKIRSEKVFVRKGIEFVKVWVHHDIRGKKKWVSGYIPLRAIRKTSAVAPKVVRPRRKPRKKKVETVSKIPKGMQKLKGGYKISWPSIRKKE